MDCALFFIKGSVMKLLIYLVDLDIYVRSLFFCNIGNCCNNNSLAMYYWLVFVCCFLISL